MIEAEFYRNKAGRMYGFRVKNHGESIVCAAVSALVLNTVNSIEAFTGERFKCGSPRDGKGYIDFSIPEIKKGGEHCGADLLLSSLALGLRSVMEEYPDQIRIKW